MLDHKEATYLEGGYLAKNMVKPHLHGEIKEGGEKCVGSEGSYRPIVWIP